MDENVGYFLHGDHWTSRHSLWIKLAWSRLIRKVYGKQFFSVISKINFYNFFGWNINFKIKFSFYDTWILKGLSKYSYNIQYVTCHKLDTGDLTSKIPVNNLKNKEFKTTFNSHLSKKTNHCILSIFPGIKISRIICRSADLFMYLHNLHVHVYIHIF